MIRRRIVICMLALLVAAPAESWAQSLPLNNWAAVIAVPSGQKLNIELNTGKKVNGKLGAVSETGISIVRGKETEDINRSDIHKVYRESGTSVTKSTLIGTGIGGGTGAIIGAAAVGGEGFASFSKGNGAAVGGIFGASVGAITGLVIGLVRHHKTLIYQTA